MDEWRRAGRAGRADDDRLWERFRTAQDTFFNAKDAEAAKEDEAHRGNLEVKESLLAEAEALLPVKDLDKTKAALRGMLRAALVDPAAMILDLSARPRLAGRADAIEAVLAARAAVSRC